MGFNNPSLPWSELERILSDRPIADGGRPYGDTAAGWRHRTPYEPPPGREHLVERYSPMP